MNTGDLLQQMRKIVQEENEPIKKRLDSMDTRLENMDKRLDQQGKQLDQHGKQLEQQTTDMNHLSTAVEALATKGDVETAVSTAKEEIQANLLDLGAKINRTLHNQETRIKNLEKHTGTIDPTKN